MFGPKLKQLRGALILVWIMVVGCSGCSKSARFDTALDDYGSRLSRVFDQSYTTEELVRAEYRLPARRVLRLGRDSLSINLLELLQLRGCDVNRLIGEHNSLLNRMQNDVEPFFYDLAFIRSSQACVDASSERNADVYQTLLQARRHKLQNLPVTAWNALLASEEMQSFFSVYQALPRLDQWEIAHEPVTAALETINLTQQQIHTVADDAGPFNMSEGRADYDRALGSLAQYSLGGTTLLAMAKAQTVLATLNQSLGADAVMGAVCRSSARGKLVDPVDQQALEYLFYQRYLGEIQPILAEIDRRVRLVRQLEHALERLDYGKLHPKFAAYWQAHWADTSNSTLGLYRSAIRHHASLWQRVLDQCGIVSLPAIKDAS